jgi:hypothetical protein
MTARTRIAAFDAKVVHDERRRTRGARGPVLERDRVRRVGVQEIGDVEDERPARGRAVGDAPASELEWAQ